MVFSAGHRKPARRPCALSRSPWSISMNYEAVCYTERLHFIVNWDGFRDASLQRLWNALDFRVRESE